MKNLDNKEVILFDGVCNLCNSAIDFVIRRDSKNHFYYASLQGETGQELTRQYGIDPAQTDSIILISNNQALVKSSAVLSITRKMRGLWPLLYGFIIIPKALRDAIYDFVARNRYQWFGKRESCRMPNAEEKSRFLD